MVSMLLPLVRLFMRAGLGVGEFELAAKLAFVRVAADNARLAQRLNVSAIAASTGLTRREVRALLAQLDSIATTAPQPMARQRTVRVLRGWLSDPAYRDAQGNPKVLPMRGGEVNFEGLVSRFAGDVTPAAVFRELKRSGAVVRQRTGDLRLRKQSTRYRGFSSDVLNEIGKHVGDLSAALVSNIEAPQQATYAEFQELEPVSEEAAKLFNAVFAERAGLLMEGIARWATSQKDFPKRTKGAPQGRRRVGVGIHFIDQPADLDATKLPAPPLKRKERPSSEEPVRKARST